MKTLIKNWLAKHLWHYSISQLKISQQRLEEEQGKIWQLLQAVATLQKEESDAIKEITKHLDMVSSFQIEHATQSVKINKKIAGLVVGLYQAATNKKDIYNGTIYKN